jgi:Zn-dependent protease
VHAVELEALARRAQNLETNGETAASAEVWREALRFLPSGSNQAAAIQQRIASLQAAIRIADNAKPQSKWVKRLGPLGVAVALLLKFKTVILLGLSKGKFLLLGLGKAKTVLSMFATMGLYWSLYGWKFGIAFVLGIYVHEMGHVWMLRHYGLRASAPMFIPGFGAFVSMYDSPANAGQDARIGLAGPLWGAAAALFFLVPAALTGQGVWMAVAHATAYINLFNLTPIWTLDGGRAFRALDQKQRIILLAAMAILGLVTGEGIFLVLTLGAAFRTFYQKDHASEPDQGALIQFGGLLLLFGAILALIPVPGLPR